jgi:hypothetical protein
MSTLTHPSMLTDPTNRRQRAASLRQVLSQRFTHWAARVWQTLETSGRLHVASELLQQAEFHELTDPSLAAALRHAVLPSDPGHHAARAATLARAD